MRLSSFAAQAGVSDQDAFEALERGQAIVPRRQRERRKRAREFLLIALGMALVLVALAVMHVILTLH